jgi:hypothetical protein
VARCSTSRSPSRTRPATPPPTATTDRAADDCRHRPSSRSRSRRPSPPSPAQPPPRRSRRLAVRHRGTRRAEPRPRRLPRSPRPRPARTRPRDSTTDGATDRAADDADTDVAELEEPKAEEEKAPIRSLKEIKAEFAGDGGSVESTGATTETEDADDAEDSPGDDDAQDEPAGSSGSGEKHTPKTDAKIDDSTSLFDL